MNFVSNGPVFDAGVMRQAVGFALHLQKAIGSREEMNNVWEELRALVRGRSVMHVRQSRSGRDTVSTSRREPSAGKVFARPPRSYAAVVLQGNLHSARPGTVWTASETVADRDLRWRLSQSGTADLAVIPLQNAPGHSDFIEIEFEERVSKQRFALLEIIGPIAADAWQSREAGTISKMLAGRPSRIARERAACEATPILDIENPAGLTRAEFHICVLINEGKLPGDLAQTLKVKKTTLRSHMRAIYSKTGVSGHVELVHRLHGNPATPDLARAS
ncbi:MAG: helix-turn-helix transcriptional regulator [Maritimibacter sp.]|nr:helix-turn-helix transcriptional regulator [Maritimibacter sp.]